MSAEVKKQRIALNLRRNYFKKKLRESVFPELHVKKKKTPVKKNTTQENSEENGDGSSIDKESVLFSLKKSLLQYDKIELQNVSNVSNDGLCANEMFVKVMDKDGKPNWFKVVFLKSEKSMSVKLEEAANNDISDDTENDYETSDDILFPIFESLLIEKRLDDLDDKFIFLLMVALRILECNAHVVSINDILSTDYIPACLLKLFYKTRYDHVLDFENNEVYIFILNQFIEKCYNNFDGILPNINAEFSVIYELFVFEYIEQIGLLFGEENDALLRIRASRDIISEQTDVV